LSEYEKIFLLHGVQEELRLDGRSYDNFRTLNVEFNKINNSYGSCELTLGETKVIATIKAEIDTPDKLTPKLGKVDFLVDCSANAAPEFQGRGGERFASEVVNFLTSFFSSANFDLSKLCIVEARKCWHVNIDIVVLESGGNLYDACAMAAKFALARTELPQLDVKADDEGQLEIAVSDDISKCVRMDVERLPYPVSVWKIGQHFVVDADLREESVAKVRLTFGFDHESNIRYNCKAGFGSLDPDTLYSITDMAKEVSKKIHSFYLSEVVKSAK